MRISVHLDYRISGVTSTQWYLCLARAFKPQVVILMEWLFSWNLIEFRLFILITRKE